MSLADEMRPVPSQTIRRVTAGIVTVFGTIAAVQNHDAGTDIASVAGYTLPLTVAFGIIAFFYLVVEDVSIPGIWQVFGIASILWGAAFAARELGMLEDPRGVDVFFSVGSPTQMLAAVLEVYFNEYGWALMICALAIGISAALLLERFIHSHE